MSTSSSGDEDVPSPAAAVLARRASRKVKKDGFGENTPYYPLLTATEKRIKGGVGSPS